MLWCDVANLVSYTETTNGMGDTITTESLREVFVNKKSIRQSEYYQALSTGLKPEIMFEVRAIDYQDEENISYNGKLYNILRTYSKNGEVTELICQAVI